jgi:hypothetical protein
VLWWKTISFSLFSENFRPKGKEVFAWLMPVLIFSFLAFCILLMEDYSWLCFRPLGNAVKHKEINTVDSASSSSTLE